MAKSYAHVELGVPREGVHALPSLEELRAMAARDAYLPLADGSLPSRAYRGRTKFHVTWDGSVWPKIRTCRPDITIAPFGVAKFREWFPWLFNDNSKLTEGHDAETSEAAATSRA